MTHEWLRFLILPRLPLNLTTFLHDEVSQKSETGQVSFSRSSDSTVTTTTFLLM